MVALDPDSTSGGAASSHGAPVDADERLESMRRALSESESRNRVLAMIAEGAPIEAALGELVRMIEGERPGVRCSIMLADEGRKLLFPIVSGGLPPAFVAALKAGIPIAEGAGSCGTAAHRGTCVITTDVLTDPLWTDYRDLTIESGIRASWSVPILTVSGGVVGTFAMYLASPGAPAPDEVELVTNSANVARIAIERNQTIRRLEGYQALVERLPAIAYVDDADEFSSNRYISPRIETILGYSVDDWKQDPAFWIERLHPDDRDQAFRDLAAAQATSVPFVSEYRLVARDGRDVWIRDESITIRDAAGNPTTVHGVMLDITDQKRAERALRDSEQRFRELLQHVELAAVIVDVNGTVQFCNRFLLDRSGYSAEAILGKSWFDTMEPDDPESRATFDREIASGEVTAVTETPIRTRSGETRLFRWSSAVIRDVDGVLVGTASIGEDVTERRQLEDKLRQSQKLEAIGQLAGGIAHDFNNLMTAIGGYAELAISEVDEDNPIRFDLLEITKAADRATSLTRQLLAFSRRQPLRPVVLDLRQVVREIEPMLRRLIGEGVLLTTVLSRRSATVTVDRSQIEQVVVNLVVNARDAMPDGGTLAIEVAVPETDGPQVVLTITDTGEGMSEEVRTHVFEPFFTTKEPDRGTGLGLSTVYGIVEQSGGTVTLESEPGRGSTFRVVLPLVDAAVDTERHATAVDRGAVASRTILVVEDEHAVRTLLRRILEDLGHRVLGARDGEEALEIEAAHAGQIDLLVSDVIMPNMRGREIAERLTAARPGIRVLFVSGYPRDDIVRDGVLDPGVNFLQKPFDTAELVARVQDLLGEG